MKRSALIVLAIIFISCRTASAVTVKQYADVKAKGGDGWGVMSAYVDGLGVGFQYANIQLRLQHEKPLYCPPENMILNMDNYLSLLDIELTRGNPKPNADTAIEVILTFAIQKSFPCSQN